MAGGPGLDQKQCGGNHLLSPWPVHLSSLTLSSRIIHSQADPRTMKELFCARPGLSQDTLRSRSRTEGPMPWLPPSQLLLSPPPSPSRYGRAFVCTRSEVSGMRDLVGEVGGEAAVAWWHDAYPCHRYRENPVWRAFSCLCFPKWAIERLFTWWQKLWEERREFCRASCPGLSPVQLSLAVCTTLPGPHLSPQAA